MIVFGLLIAAVIYCKLPLILQLIVFFGNGLIADPLPAIDEIAMMAVMVNRIRKIFWVQNWISKHKVLSVLIVVAIAFLAVAVVKWIWSII